MSASRARRRCVAGVGNPLMRDDGLGIRAVESLEKTGLPYVDIVDCGTSSMHLLDVISTHDEVIVIDAIRAGGAPGTVYRFTADSLAWREGTRLSFHEADLAHVIGIARWLGTPSQVVLYGIEPEETCPGLGLSPAVEAAIPRLVSLVLQEVCPASAGLGLARLAPATGTSTRRDPL